MDKPIDKCYRIEKISEIEKYIIQNNRNLTDFDEQLPTNFGYIYKLATKEVCFIPNELEEAESIIFSSIECYNFFLEKDSFPLDNPNPLVFELFKDEMKNMEQFSQGLIEQFLSPRLKAEVKSHDTKSIVEFIFEKLDRSENISLKDKFLYSILLGEYIRIVKGGKWLLLKKYGAFNYYFIPVIEYEDQNFVMLIDRINDFFRYKSMSLESFISLSDISSPYHNRSNTYASEYILLPTIRSGAGL